MATPAAQERSRRFHSANKSRRNVTALAYYYANREEILAKRREYRKRNAKVLRLSEKMDLPVPMVRKMLAAEIHA